MARFGDPGIDDDDDEDMDISGIELEIPDVEAAEALGKDEPEAQEPEAPEPEKPEAEEPVAEEPEAPAKKNKKSFQARLSEVYGKMKEKEREANEAIEYARFLETKYKEAQEGQHSAVKFAYQNDLARIDAEIDKAERDLITAEENGDFAAKAKASRSMATLAAKRERTEVMGQQLAQQPAPQAPTQARSAPQPQPQYQPASKAIAWGEKNKGWFNSDPEANAMARQLSVALERSGVSPETDTHYALIDQAIRDKFPEHFEDDAGQVAAPAVVAKPKSSPVAGVGMRAPAVGTKMRLDQDRLFMQSAQMAKMMDPTLDLKNPEHLKSLYLSYKKDART